MKNTMRILSFIAAAAVAGGIVGVLYAPSRGAVIRRKIRTRGMDFADNFNDTIEIIKHNIDRGSRTLNKGLKALHIR